MAEFDLSKYKKVPSPDAPAATEFDLSKYKKVDAPQSTLGMLGSDIHSAADFVRGTTLDFLGGAREGVQNLAARASQYLPEGYQVPRYQQAPHTFLGRLPIEAGKLGAALVPGVGAEMAAAKGIGLIPGATEFLASRGIAPGLARIGDRAITGAAGGAASAPVVDEDASTGAEYGGVLGGAFGVGATAANRLRNLAAKRIRGSKTLEEFQKARASVPEGIQAPIGELAGSPGAMRLYGRGRITPGSGASRPYDELYEVLSGGARNLTADAPEALNADARIYQNLKSSYEAAKDQTNNAYDLLTNYAEQNNVPFKRSELDDALDKSIDELQGKVKNRTTRNLYGDALDILKDFKETPLETFSDAASIRPAINDLIRQASGGADKIGERYYLGIKKGLDNSIKESSKGDPGLQQLFDAANDARKYQGEFEMLNRRDKSHFYKEYLKGGDGAGIIGAHLKTSAKGSDFAGHLKKLTDKLSPEDVSLIGKTYLDPQGSSTLSKQLSRLRKLTPEQRTALFGGKGDLPESLVNLSAIYPEGATAGFVPKTGYTGSEATQRLLMHAALGNPGVFAGMLTSPLFSRGTQGALRSTWLKDAYEDFLRANQGLPLSEIRPSGRRAERTARTLATALLGESQ